MPPSLLSLGVILLPCRGKGYRSRSIAFWPTGTTTGKRMNGLSIGAAWEETLAFVKREGTLLFPVALLFLALPGVVLQLLLPDSMHQTEPMKEISATSQLPPQFLLGMGVVILMAMLGALALYAL